MKIIEIMPIFAACGVTRFVVDLSNELSKCHDVSLVVLYSRGQEYRDELSPAIRIIGLDKRPGIDGRLLRRLTQLLRREKADIIHLHTASALHYAIPACWLVPHSRFVYTYHSVADFETPQRLLRSIQELAVFRSGRCSAIANSRCVADTIRHTSTLIPLGRRLHADMLAISAAAQQDIDRIKQRHNSTILLCVANIDPVKNQLMLCRCVERLLREGCNLDLILIGNPAESNYSREVLKYEGDRIHFLGARRSVMPYMALADFLCIPSTTESGPLVLIEAFFAGLIPIVTPCGDMPNKIKHGSNGFCAVGTGETDFAEALRAAIRLSGDEKKAMQTRVRRSYAPYSIESCARQYANHFHRLLHP